MSPEQANQVIQKLNLGGKPPAGQIFHVEMPLGNGVQFDQPPVPQFQPAQNILK